jgi:hypothetical protein
MSNSNFISHTSDDAESIESNSREVETTSTKLTLFIVTTYTLYILLWATVYAIAIHLEFGTVYLIVSVL